MCIRDSERAIRARLALDDVREANAEVEEHLGLARCELPGRQTQLEDGAPELVAGAGVVLLELRRLGAGSGATDHELQALFQDVVEHQTSPRAPALTEAHSS